MCLACALVWAVERAAVEGATKAAKEMEIKAEEDGSQVITRWCLCLHSRHACMACMACMYVRGHACMHAHVHTWVYMLMASALSTTRALDTPSEPQRSRRGCVVSKPPPRMPQPLTLDHRIFEPRDL